MKGEYTLMITGPAGVVMLAKIDLEQRDRPLSLSLDDDHLREVLVVTAMSAGVVEGEMVKQQQQIKTKGDDA